MAFDGIVISNIVADMKDRLLGGRIYKIYQPEQDELLLVVKNAKSTYRLSISANASLPLIYFLDDNKQNPLTAPNFCMLLRKHILNGRILDITQPGMERIVSISIEHLNELGDPCRKKLIIEMMGKHSNIIFTDDENHIVDSIKHISNAISSVREVLPGRDYVAPPAQDKIPLHDVSIDWMNQVLLKQPVAIHKAIYQNITGLSPLIANEICHRAGIDGSASVSSLSEEKAITLYGELIRIKTAVEDADYHPCIIYDKEGPVEFSSVELTMYEDMTLKPYDSISQVLTTFYREKEIRSRVRQKSTDLRKVVSNAISRSSKKYDLQLKQMKDTEKRDKFKVYGELIHTYGYGLEPEAKELKCINYYDGKEIKIPLDPQLSAMENAQKYFDRYNKLKRTYEALSSLIEETHQELLHLESVAQSLEIAQDENDLSVIRDELAEYGYMKKHGNTKKKIQGKSKPLHYISSDGFHIYVGKNNYQNDELSFKFANGKDLWFHAKKMAGSHVIVKLEAADDVPDRTYEEAARLAAYYSKGKDAPKVEIDYTRRRELKKPPHAKPGYVIYHTNWSMSIEPNIEGIQQV